MVIIELFYNQGLNTEDPAKLIIKVRSRISISTPRVCSSRCIDGLPRVFWSCQVGIIKN